MSRRSLTPALVALTLAGLAAPLAPAAAAPRGPVTVAGRPYTPALACNAARALVSSRGAIVLGTGPDLYDRYVSTEGFCQVDEVAMPAFVPSGDGPQCFVGYTCVRKSYNWDR